MMKKYEFPNYQAINKNYKLPFKVKDYVLNNQLDKKGHGLEPRRIKIIIEVKKEENKIKFKHYLKDFKK
jgi:ribosomal protein L31E